MHVYGTFDLGTITRKVKSRQTITAARLVVVQQERSSSLAVKHIDATENRAQKVGSFPLHVCKSYTPELGVIAELPQAIQRFIDGCLGHIYRTSPIDAVHSPVMELYSQIEERAGPAWAGLSRANRGLNRRIYRRQKTRDKECVRLLLGQE